jgi:hypothetical protein
MRSMLRIQPNVEGLPLEAPWPTRATPPGRGIPLRCTDQLGLIQSQRLSRRLVHRLGCATRCATRATRVPPGVPPDNARCRKRSGLLCHPCHPKQ